MSLTSFNIWCATSTNFAFSDGFVRLGQLQTVRMTKVRRPIWWTENEMEWNTIKIKVRVFAISLNVSLVSFWSTNKQWQRRRMEKKLFEQCVYTQFRLIPTKKYIVGRRLFSSVFRKTLFLYAFLPSIVCCCSLPKMDGNWRNPNT